MNFGDIIEAVEHAVDPAAPALLHGDAVVSWGEAAARSNNLARALLARGLAPGDKLALYMRNRPEYALGIAAAFKARLVHVNVNYRYEAGELLYLLDNADAKAVLYGAEFRDQVAAIRDRLPQVVAWIEVGGDGPASFDALAREGDGAPLTIERSSDDLLFLYTGGTTGMPKGVMWPHGDLREILVSALRQLMPVPDTLAGIEAFVRAAGPGPRSLVIPPLMHGTGLMTALNAMMWGGTIITMPGANFNADEVVATIARHRPTAIVIVGDSFGRPILDALDAAPPPQPFDSVQTITSSGVMWSAAVKQGLLRYFPNATLQDALSSSEAIGLGAAVTTAGGETRTAAFTLSDRAIVIDEDSRPITQGTGRIALGPPNPVGYYKDDAKTAATFRLIDGVVYSIPGDWATIEADGTLTLLGRGSACINTGGEKVFPEEVEEAVKTHDSVADALVVGVPDPKWGQAIVAVVAPVAGGGVDPEVLRAHVRSRLSGYKVPKRVVLADRPLRAVNGKADYAAARACVEG